MSGPPIGCGHGSRRSTCPNRAARPIAGRPRDQPEGRCHVPELWLWRTGYPAPADGYHPLGRRAGGPGKWRDGGRSRRKSHGLPGQASGRHPGRRPPRLAASPSNSSGLSSPDESAAAAHALVFFRPPPGGRPAADASAAQRKLERVLRRAPHPCWHWPDPSADEVHDRDSHGDLGGAGLDGRLDVLAGSAGRAIAVVHGVGDRRDRLADGDDAGD